MARRPLSADVRWRERYKQLACEFFRVNGAQVTEEMMLHAQKIYWLRESKRPRRRFEKT